ncbi:MAG: tetratricopeptide repeat protein [Candidatus Sumerlaeia bacterium]|nr:tetratricopeptide repeat protein [Candidatus Sumerlaeia bacterium]
MGAPETKKGIAYQDRLNAAGIFLLAAAVFAHTTGHGFVWDDVPVIAENEFLKSAGAWWRCFTRDFGLEITRQPAGYYRPLVFLSFWANYVLGGVAPSHYHLTNVLLHGANSVLVYAVIARLMGRLTGGLAAAVFAVHPVHAESVAFVAGRSDLLCAMFLLLTVLATMQTFLAPVPKRRFWLAAAAGLYLAALLSKELAVALPGALLAYGLVHRYRVRNLVRLCAPMALLATIYLLFRLICFPMGGPKGMMPVEGGFAERLARLLFLYAAQQSFPVIPTLGADVLTRRAWVDAAALGLLALLVVLARPRRHAADAVAWLAVFLAPTLWVNLFKAIELSDRFAYVPSAGMAALAGLAAGRYWRSLPVSRAATVAIVVAFFALGTLYASMWKTEVSLWAASVRYHPDCGRCYFNLGNAYRKAGNPTMAVRSFYKATRLLPDAERRCWAYANLARVLAETGEDVMAVEACRKAVELRPNRPMLRLFLASLLMETGKLDEARTLLDEVAASEVDDAEVQMDLARLNLGLTPPRIEPARKAYRRARDLGAAADPKVEKDLSVGQLSK